MKKIGIGALAAAGILAFSAAPAFAADKITVKVDGKEVAFDQEPIIVEDRVMVPIRFVAEAMGWDVGWDKTEVSDENNNSVRESYAFMVKSVPKYTEEGKEFDVIYDTIIWLDEGRIESACGVGVNEYEIKNGPLNVMPIIVNDRTLVGVRDIAEGIHAQVDWVDSTRTVEITTRPYTEFPRYADAQPVTFPADTGEDVLQNVFDIVNKERKNAGLKELVFDDNLELAAAVRAKELSEKFDHDRPDGRGCYTAIEDADNALGGSLRTVMGENIAADQKTADEVIKSWMNSPTHRKNILFEGFNKIGIGLYEMDGRKYWVQLFSD